MVYNTSQAKGIKEQLGKKKKKSNDRTVKGKYC
jgi:hypothetical protein